MSTNANNNHYLFVGSVFGAVLVLSGGFIPFLLLTGLVSSVALCVLTYFIVRIRFSPKHRVNFSFPPNVQKIQEMILSNIEARQKNVPINEELRISRNIDQSINDLIELTSKEYILYYFEHLIDGSGGQKAKSALKKDIWTVIDNLTERLSKMDRVKFLSTDVVKKITLHFEKIRLSMESSPPSSFEISPHLVDSEREIEYLSKLSESLIILLFPADYSRCIPARHFIREVLSRHVLHSAVQKITNPAWINGKILSYVKKHQSMRELSHKTFVYAESFEEFLVMINDTNDVNEIKQIRYDILTEIMQATTLKNLSEAKGKEDEGGGTAFLVSSKHLKKYISQLVHAKMVCEKRLGEIDGSGFKDSVDRGDNNVNDKSGGGGDKKCQFSFEEVLEKAFLRRFFHDYLVENENQHELLEFWSSVEELRNAEKTQWHRIGTDVFFRFINKNVDLSLQVDRSSLKRIEAFLLGDAGPEIFFELQKNVETTLKETYFPAFLISQKCEKMICEAEQRQDHHHSEQRDSNESIKSVKRENSVESQKEEQSHIKNHLEQIGEKLRNKSQAISALSSSLKPDSKILTMLQSEVSTLEEEHRDVQTHLIRTESWSSYLGKWRCHVKSVEHLEGEKENYLRAHLVIYVPVNKSHSSSPFDSSNPEAAANNTWTCQKKIGDFHGLHRGLIPYVNWIKSLELPSQNKSIFHRNSQKGNAAALDKAKTLIQRYMDSVLADEQLAQSEIVFDFLSPSPEYLKNRLKMGDSIQEKSKFALTNFFNEISEENTSQSNNNNSNEDGLWFDEFDSVKHVENSASSSEKDDAIAESLYALVGEVFDMRGVFKWIRKSLMTFVQITYGSSINRQIKDSVAWITSEQMILQYLSNFKKSLFGKAAAAAVKTPLGNKNDEEIAKETKDALTGNIPEVLVNLVGQQTAIHGTVKVFETLQHVELNKQLFYDILELLMYELFPELSQSNAAMQLRNYAQ